MPKNARFSTFLLLSIAALFYSFLSCTTYMRLSDGEEYEKAATVHLKCGRGQGSGAVVSDGVILTAYHVVDDCKDQPVKILHGYTMIDATLEFYDEDRDVARLRYKRGELPYMSTKIAPPVKEGDYLCVETAMPDKTRLCGSVKKIEGKIYLGFAAIFGNSGSGVYNDRGELVGVLHAIKFCRIDMFYTYTCGTIIAPVVQSDLWNISSLSKLNFLKGWR